MYVYMGGWIHDECMYIWVGGWILDDTWMGKPEALPPERLWTTNLSLGVYGSFQKAEMTGDLLKQGNL